MGPASITAINQVDDNRLMAELIAQLEPHYAEAVMVKNASPEELECWMTRAAKSEALLRGRLATWTRTSHTTHRYASPVETLWNGFGLLSVVVGPAYP